MPEKKANRLILEKNPYLLQHAYNPVNWYPWCDEAFEKAKAEDKPVFLSIGYSTCHWCHVMQHESFEDEEVAALMNENFINIKVDREEYPDIDAVYMAACQLVTGGGGWPLTVVMTPEKKPFFLGTYFPKESRENRVGMIDLVPRIMEIWDENRDQINNSAEEIMQNLKLGAELPFGNSPTEALINTAYEHLEKRFDPQFGGFGNAPKFPTPHNIIFLLRYYHHTKNDKALVMAERTLKAMRLGGIFDHVGNGFHRYSTDRQWILPHFEKMLYDQAMLMYAYTEAFAATGNLFYRQVIEEIFLYVQTALLSSEGAFYSAEDADSEGIEGKFYVWSLEELQSLLGNDTELFCQHFNIQKNGNFTDPFQHAEPNANILFTTLDQNLQQLSPDESALIDKCKLILLNARKKRVHPMKDEKILLDWNGLMIAALSYAGRIVNEPKYLQAAVKAAEFVFTYMQQGEKALYHRAYNTDAGVPAMIEDYAFFIWGLLELYQSTFDTRYLQYAVQYTDKVIEDFKDNESAGFFFSDKSSYNILVPQKEIYDGAIPSANSVMISNLITLSHFTGEAAFDHEANLTLRAFSTVVEKSPSVFTHYLNGLLHALHTHTEIVIVGNKSHPHVKRFFREVLSIYNPYLVQILKNTEEDNTILTTLAPFTQGMIAIENEPTYYICKDFTCQMPVTRIDEALEAM